MLSPSQKVYIRKARELGMRICEIVEVMRLPYVDVNNEVQKLNREKDGWNDRECRERDTEYQTEEKIKRDERTIAIYYALRCDLGQTVTEMARAGKCTLAVARADLEYLAKGDMAVLTDGKWFATGKSLGRSFGDEDDPPIQKILGGRCSGHRKLKASNANW